MTKVGSFEGRNVNLSKLYLKAKDMLMEQKFGITKDEITENTYHLRAIKQGVARIILGATRDVSLVIAGEPNAFAVTLSVGAWGKNLAISGATGFVVASAVAAPAAPVGAIAAAGSYVTAKRFEGDFWNKINDEIDKLAKRK